MKTIATLLFLFCSPAVCWSSNSDNRTYKDSSDGFEVQYAVDWSVTEDYRPGTHLILKSPGGNVMVFVLSEVLGADQQPKTEDALIEWGKWLYLRDDPKIIPGIIEVCRESWRPCVRVLLSRKGEDGGVVDSEILTFSDYYNDPAHTRVWKVFALMKTDKLTNGEKEAWALIKASVRITRFTE